MFDSLPGKQADDNDQAIGISQAVLDALPIPAFVSDPAGFVVAFNERASVLWGRTLVIGARGDHFFGRIGVCAQAGESRVRQIETPLARALRTAEAILDFEVTLEGVDGQHVHAFASVAPLKDPSGSTISVLNSFRFVERQTDLEDFFEESAVALHLVAHDGTILRANQAELDLLGYPRDEYVGRHIAQFHADDEATPDLLARLGAGEALDKYPAWLRARDGSIRHVQISSSVRFAGSQLINTRCVTIDVTEQMRREAQASERDRMSRDLLQALPTAIYTTDAAGRITFYNEAAVEFAGRRPQVGDQWCVTWKLFHPDGTPMPHDECPMAAALREGRAIRGAEAVAERPDGTRIAFIPYPTPLFDDSGKLVGAVNMLVDISDRKKTEQALEQFNAEREALRARQTERAFEQLHRSERNFALLVGSITDYAIFMLDVDGNVTNWNSGAERIKGYAASEIVGCHFSCFYTPEDRAAGRPQVALAEARTKGRYEAEGWRVRKDGSRFLANVVIDPVIDNGVLVGFAKITRDVTERKIADMALRESERRARGVIDTALDGFVQLDDTGVVIEWNARSTSMFGWSRSEAIGKSLEELLLAPSERPRLRQALRSVANEAMQCGHHLHIDALKSDATAMPVELSVSALQLDDGLLYNVFIRDLTDKLLTEASLRQAQKMEAVGQLTGGIAHDFNNLLQGIVGAFEVVRLCVAQERTAEVDRFVESGLASARRAAALTHRLLAFSRRQPLDPRPVDANPLIGAMEDLLRRTVGEHIDLRFELDETLWRTLCDANQLESSLLNLVINARDAMPDGGTLTVRSRNVSVLDAPTRWAHGVHKGEYVCFEVADSGVGMPAEVVERAFDPFFTTKPTGQGTGLGLSMVYGFARQSNGFCEIHSKPDHGSRIGIYLPRYEGEAPVEESEVAHVDATVPAGETILVVEDEAAVRSIVVEMLRQIGYRVIEAVDGLNGLRILESDEPIDLLVTDIGLPGMNGRLMADAAREKRPDLKVLLMTGYAAATAAPAATDQQLAAGMELIIKPFQGQVFMQRIQTMIADAGR